MTQTPEPYLFGILTVLGSYLLAVAVSSFQDRKRDPLKNFKPFNYKNYASFFQKGKSANK
jgi:hypothetical protein